MKTNFKTKLISLALALSLAVSAAPITVSAIGVEEQSQILMQAKIDMFDAMDYMEMDSFFAAYGLYRLIEIVEAAGNNIYGNTYFFKPGAMAGGDWPLYKTTYEGEANNALEPTREFASASASAYKATCEAAYRDYYLTLGGMADYIKEGNAREALTSFGWLMLTLGSFTELELGIFAALLGIDKSEFDEEVYLPLRQSLMSGEPGDDFSEYWNVSLVIGFPSAIVPYIMEYIERYPGVFGLFGDDYIGFWDFMYHVAEIFEDILWLRTNEYANYLFAANDLTRTGIADVLGYGGDADVETVDNDDFYEILGWLLFSAGKGDIYALLDLYMVPLAEAFLAGDMTEEEICDEISWFFVDKGSDAPNRDYYAILNGIAEAAGLKVPGMYLPLYTVTYDLNLEGFEDEPPTENKKKEGDVFQAADGEMMVWPFMKNFVEWNTEPDGSGTGYASGEEIVMPAYDLVLYAIWEETRLAPRITEMWVNEDSILVSVVGRLPNSAIGTFPRYCI